MGDQSPTEEGHSSSLQRKVLLITTVETGVGQAENINVREGDNTFDIARDFAIKHGLSKEIIPELAKHLQENLDARLQQQAQGALRSGSSGAVFGRLYQQALDLRDKLDEQRTWVRDYELEVIKAGKPRMTWSSTAMMQERTAGSFSNYGEMLYEESRQKMQMKQEKVQRLKEQFEQRESANMTFTPQLSPRSRQLWSAVHEDDNTPAWKRLADGYAKTQEKLEKMKQDKELKEEQSYTFKPAVSSKNEELAQPAVQRYMPKSPREGASAEAVSAAGAAAGAGSKSEDKTGNTANPAAAVAQKVPGSAERLYGDAMRRMQKLHEIQEAYIPYKLMSMTQSGKMSTSGIHTAILKRSGSGSIAGTPRSSTAGSIGAFGDRATARAAARAATAAMAGSSSTNATTKTFGGITSSAGKPGRARVSALGSIAEVRYTLGSRGTIAGSAATGIKALQTTPVRASMAGGVRGSFAGTLGGPRADSSQRRAWH